MLAAALRNWNTDMFVPLSADGKYVSKCRVNTYPVRFSCMYGPHIVVPVAVKSKQGTPPTVVTAGEF
jgi:hypothetical protein